MNNVNRNTKDKVKSCKDGDYEIVFLSQYKAYFD